jgi:hypothetical protein
MQSEWPWIYGAWLSARPDLIDILLPDASDATTPPSHVHMRANRYYFSYPSEWKVETVNKVCMCTISHYALISMPCNVRRMHPSQQDNYLRVPPCAPLQVKKGMQGIDAILYEKKGKGEQQLHCLLRVPCMRWAAVNHLLLMIPGYPGVFVVTFSRAGEDNKSFK